MPIEPVGRQYIEFVVAGEGGGTRSLARISAIQVVSETDCIGNEIKIVVGGRVFQTDGSLDEIKNILIASERKLQGR